MASKLNSDDIKSEDVNINSEESDGSNLLEEEDEEEEEEDIIDLDMEAHDLHGEQEMSEANNKEEIKDAISPVITQNIISTVQNTEQIKRQTKKNEFFSPKNTSTIGKLFINTTSNIITEENVNSPNNIKNEPTNKTVISKLAEIYAKESLYSEGAKVSFYEKLLYDEHIQKFINKHNHENLEKANNFINRNKEFSTKKNMKLKEKIEKYNEEVNYACHGTPNNKDINYNQIRPPDQFLADNINFLIRKDEKIGDLRSKIVEETNKTLLSHPVISEKSKKLAEKKIGPNKEVHMRLFDDKAKRQKNNILNKDKKAVTNKDVNVFDLTNIKKNEKEIQKNVEKLYQDAKDRKKRKEEMKIDYYEEPYDRDNIASESSKYLILEKFVKSFELCLLNLFNVKDNHMANFEQYSSMLFILGFVKFDPNKKNLKVEEEKIQKQEKKKKENSKSVRKSVSRGKSESSFDRTFKKVDNESRIIKESWKFLSKEQEKVNTNQILVFLSGILGLYDGEKPQETQPIVNNIKTEKYVNTSYINNVSFPNDKKSNSVTKERLYNKLILKKTILSKSIEERDKTKSVNKAEEKVKKNEILLKKVVPELNLQLYSYSFKVVQYLKFFFRYFYDNRMNYLLHANRKVKSPVQNDDLVFKPQLNKNTIMSAENYRKKCIDQIKQDFHPENTEQNSLKTSKIRIEEVYNILKQKKENEIAKMKLQQAEQIIKQCTFQPNIEKRRSKSPKNNQIEVTKKLFNEAQHKQLRLKSIEENKKDFEWEKNQYECTFSPRYVSKMNQNIFSNNPIQNDELTKRKVEQMEKARIEKKLQEYKKKNGLNKIGKNSDFESITKDQSLPSWKYGIELKTYKDTFDVRKKENKNNLTQSTYQKKISTLNSLQNFNCSEDNLYSNLNGNPLSSKRNPFIMFEVNIRDNINERLEIYNLNTAYSVCDEFCSKNKLPEEKKQYLYKLINEKMREFN